MNFMYTGHLSSIEDASESDKICVRQIIAQLNHCDAEIDPHREDFVERRVSCQCSLHLGCWLLPDVMQSTLFNLRVGSYDDSVAARSVEGLMVKSLVYVRGWRVSL